MTIVNLLLDTESIDVNKQNNAGYTAVMLAALTQVTLASTLATRAAPLSPLHATSNNWLM